MPRKIIGAAFLSLDGAMQAPGGHLRLARCDWPHVHIVCTRTRFRKGLIYLYIGFKSLFAGLRD